ncbi:putative protein N(5)-glutamine methyltransferase [Streptomyces lactacystinicus]
MTAADTLPVQEARLLLAQARTPADLAAMIDRRTAGEPLEHVLGWTEFCGLRLRVGPGVFVPRRRTEFLAHCASRVGAGAHVVVDLCCGCGAVGAAVAATLGDIDLYAVDVMTEAVTYARLNLSDAHVYQGDLYKPLPDRLGGTVDVIVANVPYVPSRAIDRLPAEARLHEPHRALDGGDDGLDVARRVISEAPQWLAPGGHLFIETSSVQATQLADLMRGESMTATIVRSEKINATVAVGRTGQL